MVRGLKGLGYEGLGVEFGVAVLGSYAFRIRGLSLRAYYRGLNNYLYYLFIYLFFLGVLIIIIV